MLIATEPCKHTFVSFNDSNKKTLLDRNEEMNERKDRLGDLVGFLLKKIKKGSISTIWLRIHVCSLNV